MKFQESKYAHEWLDGLKGIEIGGSAHNSYGLDTINVDRYAEMDTVFKKEEMKLCGEMLKVDVVAPAWNLPFLDNQWDFVLASHVLEHCYNPIKTLKEWHRVVMHGGYIFIVLPNKNFTFDRERPLSNIDWLLDRYWRDENSDEDKHHTVWTCTHFLEFCRRCSFKVVGHKDPDDKVGNGFMVVLQKY